MSSMIRVTAPVVDVKSSELQDHVVISGALLITNTVNTSQSYQLAPSLPISSLWTINPPSSSTIVNRFIKVRSFLEFTSASGAFQLTTNDGVSQFPFSQLVDVCTLSINGESVSENVSDKLSAMLCYGNTAQDRVKSWSSSAAMPDQYQAYSDWSTQGSARNPLAAFGENSSEISRGGFEYTVISPTVVRVTVVEPLWISPLFQGCGDMQEGMCNVNQLSLNIRFKADTSRAWSHSSLGNSISGVTCKFFQPPELLVEYQTPALLDRIPVVQTLSYSKCNEYIRAVPTLAAGATTTVFSDSVRLSQIPRAIYLFCRHAESQSTFEYPQSFLSIENLQMNWCNQSALFSGATKQDLYEMSVRNGLNMSYPEFSKYRGSVLCITPMNWGLLDSEAPGVQGSYTIQVQMTVKNQASVDFTPTFYMVIQNGGTFAVSQNSARASLGNLSPQMVLQAKEQDGISYADYRHLQGGSFWTDLRNVVSRVARGVATVAKPAAMVAGPYAPVVSGIGSVADSLATALGGSSSRLIGGSRRR